MGAADASNLRFVTWNWNVFNPGRTASKLALLERLQPDVAALQEVSRPTAEALRQHFPGCVVLEGLSRSEWQGGRANGAALFIRNGLEVVDAEQPPMEGWDGVAGAPDAVPPPESLVAAVVRCGGRDITVASAHPPNAAGRGDEREWRVARKLRTYAALETWVSGRDPVVLGMDANAWIDSVGSPFEAPVYDDDPQRPIMEFLREQPSRHGLRDAFRSWLDDHPDVLEEIRRRRPNGPLATTYVRGGNYPVPDRFDVVMVSPSVEVVSVEHGYEDALAAGSDHAFVTAELAVG
jgi:endonuclease/exonuclease/phosphatase family metal-dependent hydrolase